MPRALVTGIVALGLAAGTVPATAQTFPAKAVEFVVGYAPGGASDAIARAIAKKLEEEFKQPVTVVNKPGASGAVAAALVARAKPDGYSVHVISSAALTVVPNVEKVEYNALTDFTYLGLVARQAPTVCVRADAPWKTAEELFEFARANPRKIKFGTYGEFSGAHIAMEAIGRERGIEWVHIPFKGDGPAVSALLGGHVDVIVTAAGHVPYLRAGKFRGLAMLLNRRSPLFPDLPSLTDLKIKFDATGSSDVITGIVAPKGLPKEIQKKYEEALDRAVKSPEFTKMAETLAVEKAFMPGADMQKQVEEGQRHVKAAIEALGLKK
jgi:tripartite-type tricarboxylate transporter receptor subunit TctC